MKTTDSVALPVYQAAPGSDGLKISAYLFHLIHFVTGRL